MALPHILPEPTVLVQDPARCWSAAFEIWQQANADHLGIPAGPGQEQLVSWLGSGRGFLTPAGRARDEGVRLMGNVGFMRMRRMPSHRARPELLDGLLNDGYLYCAYYWPTARGGRHGHAVVVYGVEQDAILFSDPAPGRGLVRETGDFFRRESDRVVVGTSILVDLRRGLTQSLSGLG